MAQQTFEIHYELWKLGGHAPLEKNTVFLDAGTTLEEALTIFNNRVFLSEQKGWTKNLWGPYSQKETREANHQLVTREN